MRVRKILRGIWNPVKGNVYYDFAKAVVSAFGGSGLLATAWKYIQKWRGHPQTDFLGIFILGALISCALLLAWVVARRETRFNIFAKGSSIPSAETSLVVAKPPVTAPSSLSPPPRPVDLQGEILELYFFNPPEHLPISRIFVLIKIQIVNRGPDEATITHCGLKISLPDCQMNGEISDIPEVWRLKKRRPAIIGVAYDEVVIGPRIGAQPHNEVYRKGHPREGWLSFEVYAQGDAEFPNAEFTVHLKDSLGGEHRVRRNSGIYIRTGEIVISQQEVKKTT